MSVVELLVVARIQSEVLPHCVQAIGELLDVAALLGDFTYHSTGP